MWKRSGKLETRARSVPETAEMMEACQPLVMEVSELGVASEGGESVSGGVE